MSIRSIAAGLFAVVLATSQASAAVNLVTNGSFEAGINPGAFTTIPVGNSTSITGWTVVGGNVDYIGAYWQASDGVRSIDINGTQPGGVFQVVSGLVAGQTYNVSFDIAGNPDGGPTLKQLLVTVDAAVFNTSFDITGRSKPAMGWESRGFSFVASGASATLTFASNTPTPCCFGPAIDNVSLSAAVPELSTWAMMLIGFAGLGFAARRRERLLPA